MSGGCGERDLDRMSARFFSWASRMRFILELRLSVEMESCFICKEWRRFKGTRRLFEEKGTIVIRSKLQDKKHSSTNVSHIMIMTLTHYRVEYIKSVSNNSKK